MSSLNTEQLRKAALQLILEGYIKANGDAFIGSEKFQQLIITGEMAITIKPVDVYNTPELLQRLQTDWVMGFMQFIQEAKIPRMSENGKGEMYAVNNYSEPAMKVFKKAIEKEGIVYDVLVKSTMLYYKNQRNRYKKTVGNYFVQGDWRSDYKLLLESIGTGTIEEHIKEQISDGNTNYSLG